MGIWKLPYSGGTPTMVKALTEMTTTPGSGRPILKSWSGGKIYYQWNKELWALDEKNGNVENLTTLPETAFYRELTIHSSTGKIAYSEMNASGQGDIWLIEGPGAAPRKMTKDSGETYKANLLWHPRGDRLIYNARREGKPVVLQLQIWNGQVSEVSPGYSQGMIADISTDGSRLLTFLNCDESDLYAFETASQQEKVLTTALGFEGWPEISPDGKTVAFQSIPGDRVAWVPERSSLVAMPVPAIAGTQISKLSPGVYEARWSPDSEKIAFLQLSGNSFSLNLIKGSGGTSKQIVPKGVTDGGYIPRYASNLSQAADFSWAADGDRIVYCLRAEQADNIHVASNLKAVFSGGAVNDTLISNNTDPKIRFENPVWSPPGDQLVWITRTGLPKTDGSQEWTLSVSDLNTVREVPGSKTTKLIRLLGWVSSSEVAIATISDDKMSRGKPTEVTLERISVTDGRKTLISSLDQTYLSSVRLNPNGRNLSYVQSHEGRDNIFILSLDGKTHHQVTANNDPMIYLSSPAWSSDDSVVYFGKQSKRSLLTMIDHYQ